MTHSTRRVRTAFALLAIPGLIMVTADTTGAEPTEPPPDLTAQPLSPVAEGEGEGNKAPTSRLAESDPELLVRTDSERIDVMVKLDYDSIATYGGTVEGLAATSPAVTGVDLTGESANEQAYEGYIAAQENAFAADVAQAVPQAEVVGEPLRTVYGGVRLSVPANRAKDIAKLDGVVAVQKNELRQLLTDESSGFIGADTIQNQLGGAPNAGAGVIFGVLDSGAWPEHPSLEDQGNLSAPPAKADGTPRVCDFGDNPLTPEDDVFTCQNKLISGEAFLDTYNAVQGGEVYTTARDSNGHGSHTGTTTAGNAIGSAEVFGVERGPINGVAPGAWVAVYKVCGADGCFASDSAAAVQQAILDGVDVINFSISGGTDPANDPVELAFLDAYAAGVFVAASAGNDGPGASTANHLSPWTTTVAASTQTREFQTTLSLEAEGGATATFQGVTITDGISEPTPIVFPSSTPYGDDQCLEPAEPGTLEGLIVACERGTIARVEKGFNVNAGGAAGMVLYNPTLADVETDNHWLPTVHVADGTDLVAFMTANPDTTATFTPGVKGVGVGDAMAAFSSRGPAGNFIKPDVTAPGVQILAGNTPTQEAPNEGGPDGELFQAIAGTSMSSPHVAGAAVLIKALHPDWTPGQIKSALMTTATTAVVKEDLVTPADPFDHGAGRIDLSVAGNPGLTFDATADDMVALGTDPLNAVHLNLPSVNVPVLPGRIETSRTVTNVSGQRVVWDIRATAPAGSTITVDRYIRLGAGDSIDIPIVIESSAATGQYFGEITLTPRNGTLPTLHVPVAFVPQQGTVNLMSSCDDDMIMQQQTTTCTITAQNNGFADATVDLSTTVDERHLRLLSADGADIVRPFGVKTAQLTDVELSGAIVGTPALTDGGLFGYLPLDDFGIGITPIGDEDMLNYNVPSFVYAGKTYGTIGVDSNGYVVVGGGTAEDNNCCDPRLPDPARPNNVLAPFWTDLDGSDAPGILIGVLSDGVSSWTVVEWRVNVWGTLDERVFQVWIGADGVEDITFAYDPDNLPGDPDGMPLIVGAENEVGTDGDKLADGELPTGDLRIVSSDPTPGASVSYDVEIKGKRRGTADVTTVMDSDVVAGATVVATPVEVLRRVR